jgi:small-conductance mechanosensitive channel
MSPNEIRDIAVQVLGSWLDVLETGLVGVLMALIAHHIGSRLLTTLSAPYPVSVSVVRYANRPARAVLVMLALQLALHSSADALHGIVLARHATALLLITCLTWLATRMVAAVAHAVIVAHPVDVADNLNARRINTQARVLAQALTAMITLIGVSAALMTFPSVRQFGASLLASAGVAGLVVGFAAKPVLGNLLAGLQIALTQPIRLDDVVVVEGEWGRREEITGTYVVVRVWDQRRLIVPLQWFIEHPFPNWTRASADILGSVFLWVDYALPLVPLRAEAQRLCSAAEEWDGRLCQVAVTESGERAMQLRILVSSSDSSRNWDLRCKLREGLIDFIQRHYPDHLPRLRAELHSLPIRSD